MNPKLTVVGLVYFEVATRIDAIEMGREKFVDRIHSGIGGAFNTAGMPELRFHRGSAGFGDLAVRVLRALARQSPASIVLDLPNLAAASDFQPSTVVETAALVSSDGIERCAAPPPLTDDQKPLLLRLERYQHAAAEVAALQDPGSLPDALAENPLIPSKTVARAMIEKAKPLYGGAIPLFA